MPLTFVPMDPFIPDGGDHGRGLLEAENVIPLFSSWRPLERFGSDGFMSDGPVTGSYVHVYPSSPNTASYVGDAETEFHGTKEALYLWAGPTFTDVSRGSGYAAVAGDEPGAWRFASFGNDVWATNYTDEIQRRTNNAGSFADGITSTFKPKGRFMGAVREFMIVANLNNTGRFADEFAWSDLNDATWYDVADATRPDSLAGAKRIVSRPGQIMGFVGGEYGIFWKRSSMYALQFTAGDDVFRLDEISRSVGTPFPCSIIPARDGSNYFWGGDSFYRQTGLSAPQRIGSEVISALLTDYEAGLNAALIKRYVPSTLSAEDGHMVGAEDPLTGNLVWLYVQAADSERQMNRGVIYNPSMDRWSVIKVAGLNACNIFTKPNVVSSRTYNLGNLGVLQWSGVASHRGAFKDGNCAARLVTKRVAIAMDSMQQARPVRLKRVMPVFSVAANGFSFGSTQPPEGVTVTVYSANDPYMTQLFDETSALVSIRQDAYTPLDEGDEWGWLPHHLVGRWWVFEVTVAEDEDPNIVAFQGLWLEYEEI